MTNDATPNFLPVIIIGAARSGTKILRDALCFLPSAGTWPCDEINNIWRHGNALTSHDELQRRHARPRVQRYVRDQFARRGAAGPHRLVVEKTCANSLRVGFVDEVFPEARFVHLVRDGRDAAASAMRRWRGDYSLGENRDYISAKLRYVPPVDLPIYVTRLARNAVHRRFSRHHRAAHWGPRLHDLSALLRECSLEEVCAHQWRRCVDRSEEELAELPADRVFQLRYEDFVVQPRSHLQKVAEFLDDPVDEEVATRATAEVSDAQVGQARQALEPDQYARVEAITKPTLDRYGYS